MKYWNDNLHDLDHYSTKAPFNIIALCIKVAENEPYAPRWTLGANLALETPAIVDTETIKKLRRNDETCGRSGRWRPRWNT